MKRIFAQPRRLAIVGVLVFLIGTGATLAADLAEAPTDEAIQSWIKELNADRFEVRRRAEEELVKAGSAPESSTLVIERLLDAVGRGNLEVANRTVNILKELLASSDTATSQAAREALARLAASENKAIAARAASAIQPESKPGNQAGVMRPGPLGGGGIIIGGGGKLQINGGFGGQMVEFQVMGNQGHRTIHARDNDRTVDIKDDTLGGISMTVVETVNGKEVRNEYAARDANELKLKHPEAYKLYEKHTAGKQMGAVVNGQFVLGGFGNVFPPDPARAQQAAAAQVALQSLARIEAEIESTRATVQRLRHRVATGQTPEADLQPYLDQLQKLHRQLSDVERATKQP
jgi:hypothetical protein